MEKYVDLHCHSKYSDGKYSVEKLIELAKLNDVDFLSITDHDNIDSAKDIIKYRNDGQIQLINGIELSHGICHGRRRNIHAFIRI